MNFSILHNVGENPTFFDEVILHPIVTILGTIIIWVFVGIVIFNLFNYISKGKLEGWITNAKMTQPILGALMGSIPGCGGAVVVSSLYVKQKVTFGTLFATLIATVGDAAFILLAFNPLMWVYLTIFTFIFGIIFGYIADWLKIGKKIHLENQNIMISDRIEHIQGHADHTHHKIEKNNEIVVNKKYSHYWMYQLDHYIFPGFFTFSMLITLCATFNNYGISGFTFAGSRSFEFILLGITIISIVYFIFRKIYYHHYYHDRGRHSRSPIYEEVFSDSIPEILNIFVWALATIFLISLIGWFIPENAFSSIANLGWIIIIIVVLISLIPSCGPQIAIMSAWTEGVIPASAVFANALVQDGDAGIVVLSQNKIAFWYTKSISLGIGIVFGYSLYAIEAFVIGEWVLP